MATEVSARLFCYSLHHQALTRLQGRLQGRLRETSTLGSACTAVALLVQGECLARPRDIYLLVYVVPSKHQNIRMTKYPGRPFRKWQSANQPSTSDNHIKVLHKTMSNRQQTQSILWDASRDHTLRYPPILKFDDKCSFLWNIGCWGRLSGSRIFNL
jgi:hypothetical protein